MTEFASFDYNTIVTFLARDSIVLDALYAIVRPSVCLSQVDQSKTVKVRIMKFHRTRKLISTTNRKSRMRFRLTPRSMTLDDPDLL